MYEIHTSLRGADLNLLVALDALARQKSVTRAAKELGITQSAMSHTLNRIRALLEDEVVHRTSDGMVLTARAEAMVLPLRALLEDASRLLAEPDGFEPETSTRTFRFSAPDLVELLLLPELLQRLGNEAPGIDLAMVPMPARPEEALQTGELDLAILPGLVDSDAPFGPSAAPELQRLLLLRDGFSVFSSKNHPLAKKRRLTLKQLVSSPHLLVSPTGTGPGPLDAFLDKAGEARRVGLRVPSFASALTVLPTSNLLLLGPTSLQRVPSASALAQYVPPLDLPEHTVNLVWHPRLSAEPAQRWFRDLIHSTMSHAFN